ncbi:DUF2793 domain-containing protein [Salipiger sp. IMCC34102]|uniref:DUF2793 domain-containing protein n=1 Tax=Salipiger sp. IMCC34102 TaxID=2510647 RepID=UPI0013EE1108|nr:DUF2793 domain-containing protein [Salipiger sp. IMCC34102]
MTTFSPRLDLPFIEGTQAQKHVTHNEALERLDIAVQASVQLWDATTPPASPPEGQCFLVGDAASDPWAGHAGDIAAFAGGGWLFLTPQTGWRIWDAEAGVLKLRTAQGWTSLGGALDLQNLDGIGVNATSDATNRLAVAADATLLDHDGGGHQLKINKSDTTQTASLLFQSDFAGHAEMGLAGSNDFSVKVSADGSTFTEALRIDAATGQVSLPATPTGPAICQLRNSDTTTNLLSANFTDVPMNGVEDLRDTATFERAGDGIRCLTGGRIRVHGQVIGSGTGIDRAAFDLAVAINGVRHPGIGQSSYARGNSGHYTGTSYVTRWVTVAAGDIVTLQSRQAATDPGPLVMLDGECLLVTEHHVQAAGSF